MGITLLHINCLALNSTTVIMLTSGTSGIFIMFSTHIVPNFMSKSHNRIRCTGFDLKNNITEWHKVDKILKGSLDLIPSPSPSVKIQLIGGKVYLMQ